MRRTSPSLLSSSLARLLALGCGFAACADGPPDVERPQDGQARAIIGGETSQPGDWPWQAQITNAVPAIECSGSLLSAKYVLTAAHCVVGSKPENLTVKMGVHKRNAPDPEVQTLKVERAIVHPMYKTSPKTSDLAILELKTPATITRRVQTVMIGDEAPPLGAMGTFTGWGRTEANGQLSEILRDGVIPIVANAQCTTALNVQIPAPLICAGYEDGRHSAARGDDGAPLMVPGGFSGGWRQVGVLSYGAQASNSYSVFTGLPPFKPWIDMFVTTVDVFADVTGDKCVDEDDLALVDENIGQPITPATAALDLNKDQSIDFLDHVEVLQNWNEGACKP